MHSGLCQQGMITQPPTEARERVSVACVQCRPAHPQPLRFIGSALGARKRRRNRPALDPLPCPRALHSRWRRCRLRAPRRRKASQLSFPGRPPRGTAYSHSSDEYGRAPGAELPSLQVRLAQQERRRRGACSGVWPTGGGGEKAEDASGKSLMGRRVSASRRRQHRASRGATSSAEPHHASEASGGNVDADG